MTEADLQRAVIDTAHALGWMVAHFRPARTAQGWRTPVEADGAGFPDLVLVRGPRLIFAELKGEGGTLSPEQQRWMDVLAGVSAPLQRAGFDAIQGWLWTPDSWPAIERALR